MYEQDRQQGEKSVSRAEKGWSHVLTWMCVGAEAAWSELLLR